LATILVHYVCLLNIDINLEKRPAIDEVAGIEYQMLLKGTQSKWSRPLVNRLIDAETNENWKTAIWASASDWDSYLISLNSGISSDLVDKFTHFIQT
jgi:hypothetical protein